MRAFRLLTLLLLVAAVPVAAQDAQPTAAPSDAASAGQSERSVPLVVGGDLFDQAGAAFNAGDYQQAISGYSLFILLNPTFAQAYYARGTAYASINQFDDALADLQTALDLPAPSSEFTGRAHLVRSAVYLQQSRNDAALVDLNAAVAAAPDLVDAWFRRGVLYASEQEFPRALADFNEVVRLSPDDPGAYNERAFIHVQMGNLPEALDDYAQVIRLAPDQAGGYANRAGIYLQQKDYELALADLNDALRLQPDAVGLYLQRGLVQSLLGNSALSAADYFAWIRSQRENLDSERVLRPGESQVVELDQGMVYVFTFAGAAGERVTLTATSRNAETTDPLIVLLDSRGQPIAADDDGGGNYDAALTDFALPEDGVYGLVVSHAGGGSNGAVRVLLAVSP